MRLVVALSVVAVTILAGVAACTDAKTPEPGPPDAGMATPASLSTGAPADASDHPVATVAAAAASGGVPMGDGGMGEEDHHHEKNLPPVGAQVKVTFGGKESSVTVAELPQTAGSVAMPTLIKRALPNQDPAAFKYDLVGSDGFHVGTRPACNRPLTNAEIATGKIDVITHNATFDASAQLAGCYRVRSVVRIDITK